MEFNSEGYVLVKGTNPNEFPSMMSLENFLRLWEDAYAHAPERWSPPPTGEARNRWLGRPLTPADILPLTETIKNEHPQRR